MPDQLLYRGSFGMTMAGSTPSVHPEAGRSFSHMNPLLLATRPGGAQAAPPPPPAEALPPLHAEQPPRLLKPHHAVHHSAAREHTEDSAASGQREQEGGLQGLCNALHQSGADVSNRILAANPCKPAAADAYQAWRHPSTPRSIAFRMPGATLHHGFGHKPPACTAFQDERACVCCDVIKGPWPCATRKLAN